MSSKTELFGVNLGRDAESFLDDVKRLIENGFKLRTENGKIVAEGKSKITLDAASSETIIDIEPLELSDDILEKKTHHH